MQTVPRYRLTQVHYVKPGFLRSPKTPFRLHDFQHPGRVTTEILFIVEDATKDRYTPRALDGSIFAAAGDLDQLRAAIRDAVRCHLEDADRPKVIRLHLVHDEVILT